MSKRIATRVFAASAFALAAAGIGVALASGDDSAYGAPTEKLEAARAYTTAKATFVRADRDGSGALDAHEYATLAVVSSELARLNGFVAVGEEPSPQIVLLPINAPQALSGGERARVDAVSRSRFYAIAGDDARITMDEYLSDQRSRFADADRNGDGALAKKELVAYVMREALVQNVEV
jgi:hypothetical protein